MATHSSILAWRIPWTEEPGGLQSMGLVLLKHNGSVVGTEEKQQQPNSSGCARRSSHSKGLHTGSTHHKYSTHVHCSSQPHFTDGKVKAQESGVTCLRSRE